MGLLPPVFNFATGVTVTIVTTELILVGELIELICSDVPANNNNNNNNFNNLDVCFLVVRLAATSGPYPAGSVVRINVDQIVTIG